MTAMLASTITYLDANASERLRPQARQAAIAALELEGNPASVHAPGRAARRLLEESRAGVAGAFGAASGDLVFTSGGTEANALAIASLSAGHRVIVGATEHDAVRAAAPGAAVLPVDRQGRADLHALSALLRQAGGPALVCLMLANNETGVLHPVAEAAALCRAHGARLHVDAVQAAGRLAFTLAGLGADSLAISGHKLGGLKGAGALLVAPGAALAAQIAGGGQERGRRGGTPALPAIASMAAALAACCGATTPTSYGGIASSGPSRGATLDAQGGVGAQPAQDGAAIQAPYGGGAPLALHGAGTPANYGEAATLAPGGGAAILAPYGDAARVAGLRDRLEAAAVEAGAIVCGGGARLPNTACLARPGLRADTQVIALDLAGIAVSAGAACSSGKVARSHVLEAMGLGDLAGCAIRVSLPWDAREADVDAFLAAYAALPVARIAAARATGRAA